MNAGPAFDVCVVGSANIDLVVHVARHPAPGETLLGDGYAEHAGGKGLNQAVAAARAGARTAMVGAVGNDAAGDLLEHVLIDNGINRDCVQRVDAPTGRALITVSGRGENSIVVVPGANTLVSAAVIPTAAVVLAQLEVPLREVIAAMRTARANGACTVLNPAPATSLPDDLLELVDIVVPNAHEVQLLGGAAALLHRGVGTVITTLGARGASIVDSDGMRHVEAYLVTPIDTTGAGDAFCGMLASRLARGETVDEAVRLAAAAGALATTVAGAVPSIPTYDQAAKLVTVSGEVSPPPIRPS
jgi:ribokinase